MLLRRSHLYFGLLLAPWALLYGLTAYLFNHPSHFNSVEITNFNSGTFGSNLPTASWSAEARAREVVAVLNDRFSPNSESKIKLLDAPSAMFETRHVNAAFDTKDRTYSLSMNMSGEAGVLRSAIKKPETANQPAVFAINPGAGAAKENSGSTDVSHPSKQPLRLNQDLIEDLREQFNTSVHRIRPDLPPDHMAIRVTALPRLVFYVESDGKQWKCRHDELTGAVQVTPSEVAATEPISWRTFLLRLHTAHGYPFDGGARWAWAIIVDVMAFIMIFWGISGITMWWQIKATRRLGAVAISCGVVAAIWMGYAMLQAIQNGG